MNWRQLAYDVIRELTFMEWMLLAGILFFVMLVTWAQFRPDQFDIRHVLVNPETGRVDRWSVFATIGAMALTWGFTKLLFDGKGDWWTLVVYGLLMMFPKVFEQAVGPIIRQRFGVTASPPIVEQREEVTTIREGTAQ